jgi:hypothetical protein
MPGEPNVYGVSTTKSTLFGRALTVTIEADYIPPEMVDEISEACEKIADHHCLAERLRIRRQAEAP